MRDSNAIPFYLAESDQRAALFGTADFAGGEKLRAVRHAISDLEEFLASHELQLKHTKRLSELKEAGYQPHLVQPPDFDWITKELKGLEGLKLAANSAAAEYSHGLVYAVQIEESDLPHLKRSCMGIECTKSLPPSRIVGKVHSPTSIEFLTEDQERIDFIMKKTALSQRMP